MCTLDRPCGNVLRREESLETHEVVSCLNAHHFIIGTLPAFRKTALSSARRDAALAGWKKGQTRKKRLAAMRESRRRRSMTKNT